MKPIDENEKVPEESEQVRLVLQKYGYNFDAEEILGIQ